MALLDKLFGKKKTLSQLSKSELRKEEIIIGKQRDRLFKRIEDIANAKQKIFQQGATQKSPELRKALAQQFELKSQEQVMVARELNLRSKELMTVSRLRVTDKDMVKITSWIEDDAVTQDMYQERLDQILELGAQADKDALAQAGLTSAGQELIHLWDQMDKGHLKEDEALEEAEKTIRRKQGTLEKEL